MAHNFVHSFFSHSNYCDTAFVIDIVLEHVQKMKEGERFLVQFFPIDNKLHTHFDDRIKKSIGYYQEDFSKHCSRHNVDLSSIKLFQATLAKTPTHRLVAIANVMDDREKNHKIIVNI